MNAARARTLGLFALTGGACAIGFSPIFVRESEVGPLFTALYRVVLALPVLWLMGGAARTRERAPARSDVVWLVACGVFFAGDIGVWNVAVTHTLVANATLLSNTAPIVVSFGAWWLLGERVTARFAAGLALALGGTVALVNQSFALGGAYVLGDMLGLVSAAFYGAYLLSVRYLRGRYSAGAIMRWSTAVCILTLLPFAATMEQAWVPLTLAGWGVLVGFALISHVGGQGLITWGMAHLPAGFSSVVLLVQPVVAALLGWAVYAEALSAAQIAAIAVILGGIHLCRRGTG